MALHIKLIRNNIKSSNSYGKYFAKAVSQGEITLDEICEEISRNSSFSEGTVLGVVTELQDTIVAELGYGIAEEFRGFGYATEAVETILAWAFDQPGVTSVAAETEAGNAASRRVLEKCGFLPAGRRIQGRHILYDLCEGVKTIWHKGCKP